MSYTLKITVYNNRDYEQSFTLHDSNGDPLDLTGCELIFGFGADNSTLGTHVSGTSSNKCVFITDPTVGSFTFKLPYTVLRPLSAGTYFHDLVVVDTSGKREGVWQGQLVIKKGFA